ncbi:hypothetical protein BSO21_36045 [Paenibacillus odorifer]|uniref:CCA-adding enzyme C-terminal domain-containing protein n=1 Tax=Paenibacillus odorifer TaxID=189426 RepID=A0ABX3GAW9_9BACL|nr:hypothetical protein BSO21_36045 [Paenibacillus odorifer]
MLRVREAWTAAIEAMPPGTGSMEGLRRQWIAAVLVFGVEAAEGWLSLLAILPAAAPVLPTAASSAFSVVESTEASTTPAAVNVQAAREWIAQMPLTSLSELEITGNELVEALDKRPGPWLGKMLNGLLQAVASGDLPNDKQLLLLEAKRMDRHER